MDVKESLKGLKFNVKWQKNKIKRLLIFPAK